MENKNKRSPRVVLCTLPLGESGPPPADLIPNLVDSDNGHLLPTVEEVLKETGAKNRGVAGDRHYRTVSPDTLTAFATWIITLCWTTTDAGWRWTLSPPDEPLPTAEMPWEEVCRKGTKTVRSVAFLVSSV